MLRASYAKYKYTTLFLVFGFVYAFIEVVFHAIMGHMTGFGWKYFAFMGYTSIWMFPVGALSGVCFGLLNELPHINTMRYSFQAIIGSIIVLLLEYVSGMILNVLWGFNIWNYSDYPLNLHGQITVLFGFFWFLLAPLAIWIDDFVRWCVFDEVQEVTNLFTLYKKVLLFKR